MIFETIDQVKAANEAAGFSWFGEREMQIFGTRIVTGVLEGRFFVTSEPTTDGLRVLYTLRGVSMNGSIWDCSGRPISANWCRWRTNLETDALPRLPSSPIMWKR